MAIELMNDKKILNLGCGEEKKTDCINIDNNPLAQPDILHNLNSFPYPFAESSINEIRAFHLLEHLSDPFGAMKEFHRILKPGGRLWLKVPHFSRGLTHAQHEHGFDVSFPLYFNAGFTKSGYTGVEFELKKIKLRWLAFFHLLKYMGIGAITKYILKFFNVIISFLANLSPACASRIWCFWVGGFDEIEMEFICKK
ncbi:MAG: methyltransferase domain-containing protein [bacterium]|nr:methyltransferase domain-containing protein [bacterium]